MTITASGNYHYSGNGVTAYMSGGANWSGFNTFYSGKENPAVGNDYIGFAWSGDFTSSQSYAEAYWHSTNTPATITLSTGVPNAARVWMFNEYFAASSDYADYVTNIGISTALSKNTLTGNGNTAEVMLKYIHTYQATTGSISVGAGAGGVNGGFSLSNCDKQWELSCFITGIPY